MLAMLELGLASPHRLTVRDPQSMIEEAANIFTDLGAAWDLNRAVAALHSELRR